MLVVEDDKDILELITFNLERDGYEVTGVTSGEDGVDAARSARPDLVLLDLMLPGIDGLEVCRRLKGDPDSAHLPIIIVTASVRAADDEVDAMDRLMYSEIRDAIREAPENMEGLIRLLRVSQNLERIADHATNIAEEVIYLASGEIIRHSHPETDQTFGESSNTGSDDI